MVILPDKVLQGETNSSEVSRTDPLPYEIEIDGYTFTQEEAGGQHKIPYKNSELKEIALLPNPVKFDTLEDRELQIDVWQHNGQKYKQSGLATADQKFDDDGKLIDSGYTTGTAEINGEEHPFLRCYFNSHLKSIDYLRDRPGLYRDKREEIIDAVITLDHLKREGEIATAEDTANWEEIASELDVVFEEDIPLGNGEIAHEGCISRYREISEDAKNHLGEEFRQALYENNSIQQSIEDEDAYFKNEINPRELVLEETGLPSSGWGLLQTLKYNDKTGDIVVADLGECSDAVFNVENNRYEVRFNSINEFTNYHRINSSTKNKASAALD